MGVHRIYFPVKGIPGYTKFDQSWSRLYDFIETPFHTVTLRAIKQEEFTQAMFDSVQTVSYVIVMDFFRVYLCISVKKVWIEVCLNGSLWTLFETCLVWIGLKRTKRWHKHCVRMSESNTQKKTDNHKKARSKKSSCTSQLWIF